MEPREDDQSSTALMIARADEQLELCYESADLGNLDDPLDEAIYILLSLRTRETQYQQTFDSLKANYESWEEVLDASDEDLGRILRPGGFQTLRTITLRRFLEVVAEETARRIGKAGEPLTLDFLHEMNDEQALRFLMALPGVGPKTARCIMAYSLRREVFAVDTHVHRILQRIGVIDKRKGIPQHDEIERIIPKGIRRRFHMNLIHHGRAICRSQQPRCCDCVLVSFCPTGSALRSPA